MPNLVLIKHSLPEARPGEPPSTWSLSDEGRRRCATLAERLRPLELKRILASREPKAKQTARLLGAALGLPVEVREGLHEHVRDHELYRSQDDFNALVGRLFERPSERVFGDESATEALRRFADAIKPLESEASQNGGGGGPRHRDQPLRGRALRHRRLRPLAASRNALVCGAGDAFVHAHRGSRASGGRGTVR